MAQNANSDNSLKIVFGLVVVVLVGAGLFMFLPDLLPTDTQQDQENTAPITGTETAPEAETGTEVETETEAETETPDTSSETASISYFGEDGMTVLELLKEYADDVVTQDSSLGEYVDSINGIVGGTGGKYWLFYVNGEAATEGAATYQTRNTDIIEWRFE